MTTEAQRRSWNRRLRRAAARAEGSCRSALVREFNRRAERWDAGAHERAVREILEATYRQTADATYPSARAMLKMPERRSDEARVGWLQRVSQWVRSFATRRARQIATESQRRVTAAVAEAAAAGEGEAGASRRIREALGGGIGRRRARTIARTEIGAAQNAAVTAAGEASGIRYVQVWCSAEDERTRASHVAADGQRREAGEAFEVGGERLERPGDPNGPPELVVNCRCTVLLEPVIDDDGGPVELD